MALRIHHDENLEPRLPGVCALDFAGVLSTLYMLSQTKEPTTVIYFTAMLFMYSCSLSHHWWQHSNLQHRLDYVGIFTLITATALPYWWHIIPFQERWIGPAITIGVLVGGISILFLAWSKAPRWFSGVLFLVSGLPLVAEFPNLWTTLPYPWNLCFFGGVILYVLQLAIYQIK